MIISPVLLLLALLFFGFGIALYKGRTNLLHEYHRSRVSEEDLPTLGKRTGLGMLVIGGAIAAFGVLFDLAVYTDTRVLLTVGTVVLFAGLAVGVIILFRAVITYNKGLFKMIKPLMHDPLFLSGKSETATKEDMQVAADLLDTLKAHKDGCVGMAANMIGVRKRIIAFVCEDGKYMTMFNPVILKKAVPYDTEEGCLSLLGGPRPCKRYQTIKVQWQTAEFQTRIKTFTGWTAQIIQHEMDHCDGILI